MIYYGKRNYDNVKQSSPWMEYFHNLKAMFEEDPDILLELDEEKNEVTMRISGTDKYEALKTLLPEEKVYGNVTLRLTLIPSNETRTTAQLFDAAFRDNPNYAYTKVITSQIMSNPMTYVVFRKKVAQFFNDNLGDLFGNKNTLYENLARETLEKQDGVFYCTDEE